MNRSAKRWLATLLLATAASTAGAADTATLARDTDLRSAALSDATVVTRLVAGTPVKIDSRSGAWAKVSTADRKTTGYLRLLNLRTRGSAPGDSGLGALTNTFKTGSSGQSVATGVKGMSSEQLTSAKANPDRVKKLVTYTDNEARVRSGAAAAGLKAQQVAYLPTPAQREDAEEEARERAEAEEKARRKAEERSGESGGFDFYGAE